MTSKAVKRTPHNYSVSRNIRQNRDNTDKALLLFGSVEVTSSILVSSSEMIKNKGFSRKLLFEMSLFLFYCLNQ